MISKIVAVGDVHGEYTRLLEMLDTVYLEVEAPFTFVFLGDYVDRGPDSAKVVRKVKALVADGHIALRGNHEDMMSSAFRNADGQYLWLHNGGRQTQQSYDLTYEGQSPNPDQMMWQDAEWFNKLPLWFKTYRHYFVHAGVDPDHPLGERQSQSFCLWNRNFLGYPDRLSHYVVHGHTPYDWKKKPGLWKYPAGINLDTGACFGGVLSAALFTPEQDEPVKVWQI